MQTIPHGLAAGSEPAGGLVEYPPIFMFLGRLVPTKGIQILIESARRLRGKKIPFRLHIAGDGPERAALDARVRSAGLSDCTSFMGNILDSEASQEMERATAAVMPSVGGEVFGLVALECMYRGCPVVASDIGALSEVIGDGGMVFRVGDDSALADRLAVLALSAQVAAEMRPKARERAVKWFGEERMVDEHDQTFRELIQ
jgi:1,4-alpha-glucan branching enzyme